MDNSPKFRQRYAKASISGAMTTDWLDGKSLDRVRYANRSARTKANELRQREGRLKAAIRRLNYKLDEAKGHG